MADYPAARCRRYLNIFLAFLGIGIRRAVRGRDGFTNGGGELL